MGQFFEYLELSMFLRFMSMEKNMVNVLMSSTTPMIKDGITQVMLNLYQNVNYEKVHIDFVTINEPSNDIILKMIDRGSSYYYIPREIKHPARFIKKYAQICKNYDIVHVHGNSATMVLELFAATLAGVKVRIAHSHNTYCIVKNIDKLCRPLFYHLCNVRLACGREAGEWLFKNRKFDILNNGIITSKYKFDSTSRCKIRKELGWEDCFVLGHIGNFLAAKNHVFLINYFKVVSQNESMRLVLLGDGDLFENIKSMVEEIGLRDKVFFAGSVDNVSDYLSAMDIFVMPSTNEGFPLTLIEAQANGLKCMVSDCITKSVNLTGNVQFIPLTDMNFWVHALQENFSLCNRKKTSDSAIRKIVNKGYDISISAKKLEQIYFESYQNLGGALQQ